MLAVSGVDVDRHQQVERPVQLLVADVDILFHVDLDDPLSGLVPGPAGVVGQRRDAQPADPLVEEPLQIGVDRLFHGGLHVARGHAVPAVGGGDVLQRRLQLVVAEQLPEHVEHVRALVVAVADHAGARRGAPQVLDRDVLVGLEGPVLPGLDLFQVGVRALHDRQVHRCGDLREALHEPVVVVVVVVDLRAPPLMGHLVGHDPLPVLGLQARKDLVQRRVRDQKVVAHVDQRRG